MKLFNKNTVSSLLGGATMLTIALAANAATPAPKTMPANTIAATKTASHLSAKPLTKTKKHKHPAKSLTKAISKARG